MAVAVFILLAGLCAGSVLVLILSSDRSRGTMALALAFAALGGIYGLMGAPFVAAIQVLIYAGAIMVLFLFVIMMTERGEPGRRRAVVPAAILTGALAVELWLSARAAPSAAAGPGAGGTETSSLGALLLGRYLFAFEIASLLILAALVGAIALAGKKKESR